jgi:hypothetical protein
LYGTACINLLPGHFLANLLHFLKMRHIAWFLFFQAFADLRAAFLREDGALFRWAFTLQLLL